MDFSNKQIVVVGAGKSGIGAIRLLDGRGASCILYDGNDKLDKKALQEELHTAMDVQIITGEFPEELYAETDILIMSPGVPTDLPFVKRLRECQTTIWGEVELAYQLARGRIVAITGTNGKTTTTALTGEIMKRYYESVFVVGNIGTPYTSVVNETKEDSVIVAEISSFQLETIKDFHPKVSAILNITPDHLNRHHTMENYIACKCAVTKNQTDKEVCVLNYDDKILRQFGKKAHTEVLYFSLTEKLSKGMYADDTSIYYNDGTEEVKICDIDELQIVGSHNVENVMAAVGMAVSMGVPVEIIREGVIHFQAVEHRIEYVLEKDGIVYYNDSKATNTDAAIKGIEAMTRPTVLIGGGYDKQSEYDDWLLACKGRVKCLVLIGQTREKIAKTAENYGIGPIIFAESLEEAVQICRREAEPGDAVLLSPACASWGMFPNYEERGRLFKEYVRKL